MKVSSPFLINNILVTASNGQAVVSTIFSFLFNLILNIEGRAHKSNAISIMKPILLEKNSSGLPSIDK